LVKGFTSRWKEKEPKDQSLVSKIKNVGQPTVGLKEQIATVTQRLDAQTRNLDAAVVRFQNRDKEIFGRIMKAMAQRDQARANILATELANPKSHKNALPIIPRIAKCLNATKHRIRIRGCCYRSCARQRLTKQRTK
jgi:hypothetical protein